MHFEFDVDVLNRFLRYVKYDTQSDPASTTFPSTEGQLVLLRQLAHELESIGASDVDMDEHGYVTATIPANVDADRVPVIGFLAHVDTSPEMSGRNVVPIVHQAYQGGDLSLPDDPNAVIRVSDNPLLKAQLGNDIVTASGKTLLGADNKAGVAEIIAATEYLLEHTEVPHGTIRIAFTPDEEIGRGTLYFDIEKFGAKYAYTVDSETVGQLDAETFSADGALVTFTGFNTHPGNASGKMINAIKVAADFINRLPKDALSPETTANRQGFVHPISMNAGVEKTSVTFILRDFDEKGLKVKRELLQMLAETSVGHFPGAKVDLEFTEQYRNMHDVLERHPIVLENARDAIREAGLLPLEEAIRGGTDGSQLSAAGLPTPNIFAGEHNYHSRFEWVSVQDMEKSVEVIVRLASLFVERPGL